MKLKESAAARVARGACGSVLLAALASAAGLLLGGGAAQAQDQDHLGTWLTDDRKAKIELRECGSTGLCSEIVWLRDPVDENGRPWRDENHPEAAKRSRQIIGIDILKGTKKVEDRTWTGEIYDPEEGKHYYLKRIAVGSDKVEIRGCLSSGWPCRTKYWTRTAPVRNSEPVQVARRQPASAPAAAESRAAPAPRQPQERAEAPPQPAPQPQRQRAASVPPPDSRPEPPAASRGQQRQAAATAAPQFTAPAAPAPAQRPQPRQAAPEPRPQPQPQAQRPQQPQPQPQPQVQQQQRQPAWRQQRVASAPSTTAALQAPRPGAPAGPGSGYLVQVTAGQDQNEALRTFGKLQSRHPHLLGGYLPNIQKVDLGERGIWYRVRVGPMGQQASAQSFCQRLKAAGADCLIRRD